VLLLLFAACSDYELSKPPVDVGLDVAPCEGDGPSAYSVPVDATCSFAPPTGTFTPVVEWQWSTDAGAVGYDDVMMTPVVGDLDGDGVPEVVLTAYANNAYSSAGALVVLAGDGSGEEHVWTDIGGYQPAGTSGVALGDLDADGTPEIVFLTVDSRVVAIEPDGTLRFVTDPRPDLFLIYSYPTIADLEGDGRAEVIVGRGIWRHDGSFVGAGAYGWGGSYAISVAADLDGDGLQEVVVGNAAYTPDGSTKWYNPSVPDGWVAIGDFDADGQGEVASVGAGGVYLLDTDGTLIWGPNPVPGGGGGPPTVADFDGDGAPEVGVAGLSGYVVYDTDGTQLWVAPTTDASSAQTGSSVFDFEGDGSWEVVYADELVLWVYDGATGAPVLAEEGHSSWTLFEYPLVVDVDGDGEAEIVLASNDSINPGWQGLTVIGDASRSWAPTAPVWNQHGYSITNVEDDLSIPRVPVPNWELGHNSFRAGGLREGPGNPAPNLRANVTDLCWSCDAAIAKVYVQVENTGAADVVENVTVDVAVTGSDGVVTAVGTQTLTGGLHAGEGSAGLVFEVDGAILATSTGIEARGDEADRVAECDETDNRRMVGPGVCAE
jgi:hypothetical protein